MQSDSLVIRVRSLAASDSARLDRKTKRITNCDDKPDCERPSNVQMDEQRIPTMYTCQQELQQLQQEGRLTPPRTKAQTTLSVDYEVLLPAAANIEMNLRMLHWRLLLASVQETNIHRCRLQKDSLLVRRKLDTEPTAVAPPILYAIESDLDDSSIMPVECNILSNSDSFNCLPVRTSLLLSYDGNNETDIDANIVHDYVHEKLQNIMEFRSDELRVSNVKLLQYVGQFDLPTSSPTGTPPIETLGDGDSGTRIGTLVVASSVLLLLLTLIFVRRYQESNEDTEVLHPPKDVESLHADTAQPPSNTALFFSSGKSGGSASSSQSSSSPLNNDTGDGNGSSPVVANTPMNPHDADDVNSHVAIMPALDDADGQEVILLDTRALAAAGTTTVGSTAAHALPPRPPRRESVKLKKKRKRRRKSKRPVLRKMNSREIVNPMQAIPEREMEEEGSDFGSEGSEYTTTDDEDQDDTATTDSEPSSAQPAVRSQSDPTSNRTTANPEAPLEIAKSGPLNFVEATADLASLEPGRRLYRI